MDKHTMEYYSATKRDEVLIDPTTRRNLENTLSKRSQTQKVTCCMTPFTCNPQHGQIIETAGCQGWVGYFPGTGFHWGHELAGGGCTTL